MVDRRLTDRERAQITECIRAKAAEAGARFRAADPRRQRMELEGEEPTR